MDEERRTGRMLARNLVLKSGEHPQVLEMYHLYRELEWAYGNALERAIRAEERIDQIRAFVREAAGNAVSDERGAAGGDFRNCR